MESLPSLSRLLGVAGPGGPAVLDQLVALALGPAAEVRLLVTEGRGSGWSVPAFASYAEERLRRAGLAGTVTIAGGARADGSLADVVVSAAQGCDLVLVSSEGPSDPLPQRLVTRVRAPLLVEPAGQHLTAAPFRAVVAVRDDVDVEPTVAVVAALHGSLPVEALVVHVPDLRPSPRGTFSGTWEDGARLVDAVLRRLREEGIAADGRIHPGSTNPPAALNAFAEDWDATAIIVNSRRAGGLLALLAPSTARAMIRRGTRPVLLTPG